MVNNVDEDTVSETAMGENIIFVQRGFPSTLYTALFRETGRKDN
jgi:hypothetical protein